MSSPSGTELRDTPEVSASDATAPSRRDIGWLGLLTALAAVLRVPTLDVQSFWSDEAITVLLLRLDLGDLLGTIPDTESTPPLYYVAAWFWAHLAGDGEVGLRALSAVAGIVLVPVVYLAAGELGGRRSAILAGALVAVSPPLVWYSQEARAYALATLLVGIAFAAFVRIVTADARAAQVLWAGTSVLAVWTHTFAVFPVAAAALALLAVRRRRVIASTLAVAVGALAALPLALAQRENGFAADIAESGGSLPSRVAVAAKQLVVGHTAPGDRALAAAVVLLLIVAAVAGRRTRARVPLPVTLVAISGVVAPVALALLGADYVNTRNLLVGLAPVVVVVSVPIASALDRPAGLVPVAAALAALAAVPVVVVVDDSRHRQDWRGLAAWLGAVDGSRALLVGPDHEGWYARAPLLVYLPNARAIDADVAQRFDPLVRRSTDAATPAWVEVKEIVSAGAGWPRPPVHDSRFAALDERRGSIDALRLRSRDGPVRLRRLELVRPGAALLLERAGAQRTSAR